MPPGLDSRAGRRMGTATTLEPQGGPHPLPCWWWVPSCSGTCPWDPAFSLLCEVGRAMGEGRSPLLERRPLQLADHRGAPFLAPSVLGGPGFSAHGSLWNTDSQAPLSAMVVVSLLKNKTKPPKG